MFPIHPRTEACIVSAGLKELLDSFAITTLPPQGYLEMLGLMKDARVVLTDSGGIQEETTALGVPCITLRESTERPITVSQGTNTIVGTDANKILAAMRTLWQPVASVAGCLNCGMAARRSVLSRPSTNGPRGVLDGRHRPPAGTSAVINAMTVDVEDYFQVSAFEQHVDKAHWQKTALPGGGQH